MRTREDPRHQTDGASHQAEGSLDEFVYVMNIRGYYVLDNAIRDPALLGQLRQGIDHAISDDEATARSGRYTHYSNPNVCRMLATRGPEFIRLLEESAVQPYIDRLLTDTCIISNYSGIRLQPFVSNVVSHVHRDSQRYSRDYLLMCQVLYFIDDFTAENGATYILPGSHHSPDGITDELFFKYAVRIIGKAGTALIFNSLVWHAGGNNTTQAPRRAIAIVYTRSYMKQMIDIPRNVQHLETQLTAKAKRLLGYNVRVPSSLEEFYVAPDQRLYKPNQG